MHLLTYDVTIAHQVCVVLRHEGMEGCRDCARMIEKVVNELWDSIGIDSIEPKITCHRTHFLRYNGESRTTELRALT